MKELGVVGVGVILLHLDEGDGVIEFAIPLLLGYHARHATTRSLHAISPVEPRQK